MNTEFPFVEVTKKDRALVGKPDPGTRVYKQGGPDSGVWFTALMERYPNERFVSPGGVSMFAEVTRAAVHVRLKAGKLTAFCYQPTEVKKTIFGNLRKIRKTSFVYIPVSECEAWGRELKERRARLVAEKEFESRKKEWVDRMVQLQLEESGEPKDLDQSFLDESPKHEGKTSVPKMQRKLQEAKKSGGRGVLKKLVGML
jgi:hypothetical protein